MSPRKKPPASAPALDTFAARLLHARTLRGLGTRELSGVAGLSPAAVHYIEHHPGSDVKLSSVLALARELGVHPSWLAWGLDPMEPYPDALMSARESSR